MQGYRMSPDGHNSRVHEPVSELASHVPWERGYATHTWHHGISDHIPWIATEAHSMHSDEVIKIPTAAILSSVYPVTQTSWKLRLENHSYGQFCTSNNRLSHQHQRYIHWHTNKAWQYTELSCLVYSRGLLHNLSYTKHPSAYSEHSQLEYKPPTQDRVMTLHTWTSATATVRRTRETHLVSERERWRMTTENTAVVSIFSWYVTCVSMHSFLTRETRHTVCS